MQQTIVQYRLIGTHPKYWEFFLKKKKNPLIEIIVEEKNIDSYV